MNKYRLPIMAGMAGMIFSGLIAVRVLSDADWDVTIFTAFGENHSPTRDYAEERLGDVFLRADFGHDGRFFFVQANDPFVLDPGRNASVLDRPRYRSQRMLYPILASGFGLFGPEAITWGMLAVNLMAMGAGSFAVALIAMHMGGSAWWGLTFALNIGFISEANIGGAGVVAAVAAFGAVYALMRGRHWIGVGLLAAAALSREAMLIAAFGTFLWYWRRGAKRQATEVLAVPIAVVGVWAVYLRMRLGWPGNAAEIEEIGLPLVGFFQASSSWAGDPVDLAAGVAVMLLLLLFARRVLISPHIVGLAFVGFALLGVLFTAQVWRSYFDITRAVAPIITCFVLLVFLNGESDADRTPHPPNGVPVGELPNHGLRG